jgi:hypothetical protein
MTEKSALSRNIRHPEQQRRRLPAARLEARNTAKRLVTIHGGHFAPYLEAFDVARKAAIEWFVEHLLPLGSLGLH